MFEVEIEMDGVSKKYRRTTHAEARKMAKMLAGKLQIDAIVRRTVERFDLILIDTDGNRIIVAAKNLPKRAAVKGLVQYDWIDSRSVCVMWPSGWDYPDFGGAG